MNREQLAQEAVREYSKLRDAEAYLEGALERAYTYKIQMSRMRDQRGFHSRLTRAQMHDNRVAAYSAGLALSFKASQRFYEENHAELYDLAREEMEAAGHPFSEGHPQDTLLVEN